ncbi:MAG: type II secretion system protein [Armatimonadota bacterium]
MFKSSGAARRAGFTLIELLIVIVVIAILALIVIPRVTSAVRKSRESTLKENIHILRTAIAQFTSDTGLYPTELADLSNPKTDAPTTAVNDDGGTETIPAGTYNGPYLHGTGGIGTSGIPINPFKPSRDADYGDADAHWTYGIDPGIVHPAVPTEGRTLDGVPYSEL